MRQLKKKAGQEQVNPTTGLPYVIAYEGVDNYSDPDSLTAKARENLKSNMEDDEWS